MKSDKNIEEITRRLLSEVPLESPSLKFVEAVMTKLQTQAKTKEVVYQPLISKKIWVIVIICTMGGVIYTIFNPLAIDVTIDWLNFSFIENYQLPTLFDKIQLPDFFGITFGFFGVVVLIQMFLLNNYIKRRNIFG